jgi:hypothetical protein
MVVTPMRGDGRASGFEGEDNEPPLFEELRDEDTTVRPELELDDSNGENGAAT